MQQREPRVETQLPICIAGAGEAFTRDISATGAFIVQNVRQEMGARIDFSMDFDTPAGKLKLTCTGEVMRVEEIEGRFGIGVKIIKQSICADSASPDAVQ